MKLIRKYNRNEYGHGLEIKTPPSEIELKFFLKIFFFFFKIKSKKNRKKKSWKSFTFPVLPGINYLPSC